MIKASIRLRKAILNNDLGLCERILKASPSVLHSPDFEDKSNTPLHLAAQHGHTEIVKHLISLEHRAEDSESEGLHAEGRVPFLGSSCNTDDDTPLHLAASHSHASVVNLLCSHFPETINRANKNGQTPLHLASRANPPASYHHVPLTTKGLAKHGDDSSTVEALLKHNADINVVDKNGDTCLHCASAWGNLKSIRVLAQAGADPICCNYKGWTPQSYSISVQAEVYYKSLVAEWERRKAQEVIRMRERRGKGGGGLRLVKDEETQDDDGPSDGYRTRAESTESAKSTNDESNVTAKRNGTWK